MAACEAKATSLSNPVIVQSRKINLVICGSRFTTTDVTLKRFPNTKLAILAQEDELEPEYFFDRDADVFREVLRFYRSGVLHMPKGICTDTFKEEIQFWALPTENMASCCAGDYWETKEFEKQFNWFESRISKPEASCCSYRYDVWSFLTDPDGSNTKCPVLAKIWVFLYLCVILTQTIAITLGSHHSFRENNIFDNETHTEHVMAFEKAKESRTTIELLYTTEPNLQLILVSYLCSFFFIAEIIVRFLSCPDKRFFCRSPTHILDFSIVLVELLNVAFIAAGIVLINTEQLSKSFEEVSTFVTVSAAFAAQMRVFRLLGYATIYSGLRVMLLTLYKSWKEIGLLIIVISISVLIYGPIMYYADIKNNSSGSFTHIAAAYWWVIVTMTTVGYGDFYPSTLPGYLFAGVVMLTGLMLTALPVAIIGANFYTYYEFSKKRQREARSKPNKNSNHQQLIINEV